MTLPKVHVRPDTLPRIAVAGLLLSVVAILIAAGAFVRISLVASNKADKADANARATQQRAAVSFCRIADANRLENDAFSPPSTPRGEQLAGFWSDLYNTVGCAQVLASQPKPTLPRQTSAPPRTPTSPPRPTDLTPSPSQS